MLDLLQRFLQRHERLLGQVRGRNGALDSGAQHREWRLELVARVGGEASQGDEAPLEPHHHLVQRLGQSAELVLHARLRQSPVQAPAIADLAHFGDDLIHGAERAARDPRAGQHANDEPERQHQGERGEQLLGTECG